MEVSDRSRGSVPAKPCCWRGWSSGGFSLTQGTHFCQVPLLAAVSPCGNGGICSIPASLAFFFFGVSCLGMNHSADAAWTREKQQSLRGTKRGLSQNSCSGDTKMNTKSICGQLISTPSPADEAKAGETPGVTAERPLRLCPSPAPTSCCFLDVFLLFLERCCCWNLGWVLLLSLAGCCGRSEGRSQVGAGFMGRKRSVILNLRWDFWLAAGLELLWHRMPGYGGSRRRLRWGNC